MTSCDVYTMKKFLNSYVNQQRFFGRKGKKDTIHNNYQDQFLPDTTEVSKYTSINSFNNLEPQMKLKRQAESTQCSPGLPSLQSKKQPPLLQFQGKQMMKAILKHRQSISLPYIETKALLSQAKQEKAIETLLLYKKDAVLAQKNEQIPLYSLIGYSKLQKQNKNFVYFNQDLEHKNQILID